MNCAPNFITRVSKEFIDFDGSPVNHLRVAPFKEVGKTLQKMLSSIV